MNSEDFLLTPGDFPITDDKVKKKAIFRSQTDAKI